MVIDKTVLVCDGGYFQPLAHILSKQFQRVLYFRDWRKGFYTVPSDLAIGDGYEDIERVDSLVGAIHETDLFIFPDLYWSEEQEYLKSLGKLVFGPGRGEDLELYRSDFYEMLKGVNLPVVPYEMVMGVKKLRQVLEKTEDKWIKVSFSRGVCETWHFDNYKISKPRIDQIEYELGCLSEDQSFMVQDALESKKEVGSDQIVVDGKFPKTVQYAVEGKDKTALTRMCSATALPKEVQQVNKAISPLLLSIRGYFSTEIRIGVDGNPYLIDPTCRHASPCGETYDLLCSNLGEIILAAAQGEIQEPVVKDKFAAQAVITSELAETMSLPIYIHPRVRQNVFLYHSGIRDDGQECVFKTGQKISEIGSIAATGKTIDEAINRCREVAKDVKGFKVTICLDNIEEHKKELMQ